jgi:hypothetical protein
MRSILTINASCFLTMLSHSTATLSSKCQYIKLPVVLALMLRTSEPSIGHGHIRCGYSAHQSQVLYRQAVIEELHRVQGLWFKGCTTYFIPN